MPHNNSIDFKEEKQVAIKTTGYKKLHVTVMLYITANENKLPPYVTLNRMTVPKRKLLKRCNSSGPKKCTDDTVVKGRLAWMCMGISSWCVIKAMKYACSGCISWPSLRLNQQ
jgi:hypothetical protein